MPANTDPPTRRWEVIYKHVLLFLLLHNCKSPVVLAPLIVNWLFKIIIMIIIINFKITSLHNLSKLLSWLIQIKIILNILQKCLFPFNVFSSHLNVSCFFLWSWFFFFFKHSQKTSNHLFVQFYCRLSTSRFLSPPLPNTAVEWCKMPRCFQQHFG